jgi:hypothetical protein
VDNVGSNGIIVGQAFLIYALSYRISELFPCIFYVPDKSFMVNNVAELHSCLRRRLYTVDN